MIPVTSRAGKLFLGDFGGVAAGPVEAPAATRRLFPTLKIRHSCCCQERYRWIFLVIYDFPLAGKPTMITTNFAPTSLCAIFPSGETRDRVMPGMFNVVAGGLLLGVADPEFCLIGGLPFCKYLISV